MPSLSLPTVHPQGIRVLPILETPPIATCQAEASYCQTDLPRRARPARHIPVLFTRTRY